MESKRKTDRIRFRYGVCLNDQCEKCKSKEVQEVPTRKELLCSVCGRPLRECPPPRKKGLNGKLVALIIGGIVLLGGLGAGGYFLWDAFQQNKQQAEEATKRAKKAENEADEANANASDIQAKLDEQEEAERLRKEEEDRQKENVVSAQHKADSIIAANEKLLEEKGRKIRTDAKSIIEAQITSLRTASETLQYENISLIDTMEVAINEAWKNAEKPVQVAEGPTPSWGRYQGTRKNGKPDGTGVLYITRSTTINGETASPGERIEGVFRDGYVNMGTWYKNDGNTVVVKDFKVI